MCACVFMYAVVHLQVWRGVAMSLTGAFFSADIMLSERLGQAGKHTFPWMTRNKNVASDLRINHMPAVQAGVSRWYLQAMGQGLGRSGHTTHFCFVVCSSVTPHKWELHERRREKGKCFRHHKHPSDFRVECQVSWQTDWWIVQSCSKGRRCCPAFVRSCSHSWNKPLSVSDCDCLHILLCFWPDWAVRFNDHHLLPRLCYLLGYSCLGQHTEA